MQHAPVSGISVVLIARDSARTIARCLSSLEAFEDVVVYDNGSTDDTVAIAESYGNVRLIRGDFDGFGPTRNRAAAAARFEVVLSLDTDEWLTAAAVAAIRSLPRLPDGDRAIAFYRRNVLEGRPLRSGLGRERVKRLYHRGFCRFDGRVHERLVNSSGQRAQVSVLRGELGHDPYESVGHLFFKRWQYARPWLREGSKAAHPAIAFARALWRFGRCYVLQYGFIDGWRGFVLSCAEAYGTFLKYAWGYAERRATTRR